MPAALTRLQSVRPTPIRAFDRTAGHEIQGVAHDPLTVVDVVVTLMRSNDWRLGIGIGPVDEPLPRQARAGTVLRTTPSQPCGSSASLRTRTESGWEVTDLLTTGLTQQEIAHRLGISPSAVSQRVRRSGWAEQLRAQSLATHHLSVADGRTGSNGIPKE